MQTWRLTFGLFFALALASCKMMQTRDSAELNESVSPSKLFLHFTEVYLGPPKIRPIIEEGSYETTFNVDFFDPTREGKVRRWFDYYDRGKILWHLKRYDRIPLNMYLSLPSWGEVDGVFTMTITFKDRDFWDPSDTMLKATHEFTRADVGKSYHWKADETGFEVTYKLINEEMKKAMQAQQRPSSTSAPSP